MEKNSGDRENAETSAGTRQSGQLLSNDTMTGTADRSCTQKLTIPTLEKQDHANASMWWRQFVQYMKMTKDIDLSTMTNNQEILPQYRDQLKTDIKDIFICAIGQNAITVMQKRSGKENRAHCPFINYARFFDCTLLQKGTYTTKEPISSS